jgi:hypothetical protein
MATANRVKTLQVVCPKCFDADAAVTLDLNDLDLCTCCGCDETFSADEAVAKFTAMAARWEAVAEFAALAARWAAVAKWIKAAPVVW